MKKAGIVHRDIKSDNILINPISLQIKLVDFGLALVKTYISDEDTDKVFIGTPMYMPPGMLKKKDPYRLIASDIWSSAVLLLEMLQGSHPYQNCTSEAELLTSQAQALDLGRFDIPCQVVLQGCLNLNEAHRSKIGDVLKFLRTAAPIDKPSPRRSRWATPLSKSLNTVQ
jgi:serine/threonine protein kinase